jgi:hypothetical protein
MYLLELHAWPLDKRPVLEFIEFIGPVFAETSQILVFNENERFELVFAKTVAINSGTVKTGPV